MMGQIVSLSVYVLDLEGAVRFYVERLDFHRRSESPPGSDGRWVTLSHAGGQTELVLTTLPSGAGRAQRERPQGKVGSFTGVVFSTDDIEEAYQDLSSRGVTFGQIPKREGWGAWAQFEDPDGNTFLVVESPTGVVIRGPHAQDRSKTSAAGLTS
ncbi:MAG TPA: VOC family protein [bacterium]|jgi:predicted enzyme related to lactoylglutathione lyase|nr:VOC family protein [bacterium]